MTERRLARLWLLGGPLPLIALLLVLSAALLLGARRCGAPKGELLATLGDLKPVHAGVSVGAERVNWLRRLALGERVATDADGRARLRLDDGLGAVLDRDSRVLLGPKGLVLESGRLHVTSPLGVRSEVVLGELAITMSGAVAGLEHRAGKLKAYVADGELSVRAFGREERVHSGETARIENGKLEIVPERAYDDWTAGLAEPWAARGTPRRTLGELWGIDSQANAGAAGSPLTIRAHHVRASVEREFARSSSETTFFNAGSAPVDGDYRFALPPGALVSGFSVTRNGSREQGQIALASRGTVKATAESGVLEWAGDGWLRGRLSGIQPGQEIKVSVDYGEWLSPRRSAKSTLVEYRYPLAGDASAPLIGEFSARVDAAPSSPLSISAGYGASNDGNAALIARSDFRPSADLVVDVEQRPMPAQARLYVAPPQSSGDDASTVFLRAELPREKLNDGVTLALVVDTSGSIEAPLLDAERALVEALLGGLGARDRVLVLAADQGTRPLGPKTLGSLDAARRQAISKDLASLSPGGATDLGRALEAAADALPADAPSALLVYVGDGWATLGDRGAEEIASRLARRAGGTPRLGAVAMGPLANRRLLSALTRGQGPLLEVTDSADAARTAIELMSDALRPALAGVEVDFGAGGRASLSARRARRRRGRDRDGGRQDPRQAAEQRHASLSGRQRPTRTDAVVGATARTGPQ
ncbi:MAG: VWA domain-containing protein [Polyangiaceae bacterium]